MPWSQGEGEEPSTVQAAWLGLGLEEKGLLFLEGPQGDPGGLSERVLSGRECGVAGLCPHSVSTKTTAAEAPTSGLEPHPLEGAHSDSMCTEGLSAPLLLPTPAHFCPGTCREGAPRSKLLGHLQPVKPRLSPRATG